MATLVIRKSTLHYTPALECEAYLLERKGDVAREGEIIATVEAPEGEIRWENDGPAGNRKAYWWTGSGRRHFALGIISALRDWEGGLCQGHGPRNSIQEELASFRLLTGDLSVLPKWSQGVSL